MHKIPAYVFISKSGKMGFQAQDNQHLMMIYRLLTDAEKQDYEIHAVKNQQWLKNPKSTQLIATERLNQLIGSD